MTSLTADSLTCRGQGCSAAASCWLAVQAASPVQPLGQLRVQLQAAVLQQTPCQPSLQKLRKQAAAQMVLQPSGRPHLVTTGRAQLALLRRLLP